MKFRLVEDRDILLEATSFDSELTHILTDIANCQSNTPGMMNTMYNQYSEKLLPILNAHNITEKEFKDKWEVHHITGIHPVSKFSDYNNPKYLAFVRKGPTHKAIHEYNVNILKKIFINIESQLFDHNQIDVLILRVIAIAIRDSRTDIIKKLGLSQEVVETITNIGYIIAEQFVKDCDEFNKDVLKVVLIKDLM